MDGTQARAVGILLVQEDIDTTATMIIQRTRTHRTPGGADDPPSCTRGAPPPPPPSLSTRAPIRRRGLGILL